MRPSVTLRPGKTFATSPDPYTRTAQIVGEYHLGEFVNRFRHGSLVMKLADSDVARLPTLLFGTINGVIGVIASVPQAQFAFLSKLQVGHGWLHTMLACIWEGLTRSKSSAAERWAGQGLTGALSRTVPLLTSSSRPEPCSGGDCCVS